MKNSLKEHRRLKNLTQEELSKSSGISIRTIQRIEKGLSTGSSHTLKTLAKTLSIESSDIFHDEGNPKLFVKNNIKTLKLMNFSVLTMLVIPFGNIIFPSIIFFKNRNDRKMNTIGKKILNFQILSMLALPFFLVILFLLAGKGYGGFPIILIVSYLTYGLANIIITIHISVQINKEKEVLSFVPNVLQILHCHTDGVKMTYVFFNSLLFTPIILHQEKIQTSESLNMRSELKIILSILFVIALNPSNHAQNNDNELVVVDGKRIAYKSFNIENRKKGEPILVFETGLGGGTFGPILPFLPSNISGIQYARNGVGKSELDTEITSDSQLADRLHNLLTTLNIEPPYLLVGHSIGGPYIRLFASKFPNEVCGLVFSDPTDFMLTVEEDEEARIKSKSATGYRETSLLIQKMMSENDSFGQGGLATKKWTIR